ncbi:MAG TPA: aldo/keto reductase, partial [Aestuariivirgaceae bacterium]|nr:aldo/keto reductase [Aestuariivirgaceae bacterium]
MGPQAATAIPRKLLFPGGPAVSRLCLGTMMFGDQTDEAEAARILDAYFAAGGDFIDTADTYVDGESERILGRALG